MKEVKEKKCFKCGEVKPLTEFYKHKQMADGRVNKCRECNKMDVTKNRERRIDYYREYDRARGARQTDDYRRKYCERFPVKRRAQHMVSNSIRDGKLFREPCEVCGATERVHAHHDDYAKPLNIRWLCAAHHSQWHRDNGEGKNAH